METVIAHQDEKRAPGKRQNVDDGPMMPMLAASLMLISHPMWRVRISLMFSVITCGTVEVHDDGDLPVDVSAKVLMILMMYSRWRRLTRPAVFLFLCSAGDCSVITAA